MRKKQTIGERLLALRQLSGKTQKAVASDMGVSVNNYAKLERGTLLTPRVDMLGKYADYYQTSTDYLLGRTSIREPYPPLGQSAEAVG